MRRALVGVAALAFLAATGAARAQSADVILVNGKILTVDKKFDTAQALAIHDGKILAVGSDADIRKRADQHTKVIDLAGHTVVPGLIDSHIHAIRAGLTYTVELSWIGVPSLAEGLNLIREAARSSPAGTWIKVGGGWTPLQFKEKRYPTPAEITAVAPNHPVYVQHLYDHAFLTPAAMTALNITEDAQVPPHGKVEKDGAGKLTGTITGDVPTFQALVHRIPSATFDQQVEGTEKYFHELNRLGLTGISDVAGGGLFPVHYRAVEKLWRTHELTVRVAYHFQAQHRGHEFEEYQQDTMFLPQGFGDDMMRFAGLGEGLTWGMYDGSTIGTAFNPSEENKEAFYKVAKWAAERGMTVHQHAASDHAASQILDIFERVNKEVPITNLRWQLTHIEDASVRTLERMKALHMGWSVQDRLYYGGEHFLKVAGEKTARRAPPIETGLKMGLMVAAGTDSDQVSPFNPFVSLRWLLDGKAVDGTPIRGPEESPNREQALRMYTINAAWFTENDDKVGSLEPGKYADLAVLSADYLNVPTEDVGKITSLLTLVGGHVVYAAGPYASLGQKL